MASTYYDSSDKSVIPLTTAKAEEINAINSAVDSAFIQVETDLNAANSGAAYWAAKAEDWATEVEDTEVDPGLYSAFHWSAKAEGWAETPYNTEIGIGTYSALHWSTRAELWAEELEDVEVTTGKYSSLHWAAKSEEWSEEAIGVEVTTGKYSALHWSDKANQYANRAEDTEVEAGEYSSLHWSKKSEDWAITPEDTFVSGTDYSALHWAAKAAASASAADGSDGAAAASAAAASGSASAASGSAGAASSSESAAAASAVSAAGSAALSLSYVGSTAADAQSASDSADAAEGYKDLSYQYSQDAQSVLTQDLSSVLMQLPGNAALTLIGGISEKEIIIYDTTQDSDGGAWRYKCTNTSWYNETLGTDYRGGSRIFPSLAVIAGGRNGIGIWDLSSPTLDLWMWIPVVNVGNEPIGEGNAFLMDSGGAAYLTSVAACNGRIYYTTTGYSDVQAGFLHLPEDCMYYWDTQGLYRSSANVAERNDPINTAISMGKYTNDSDLYGLQAYYSRCVDAEWYPWGMKDEYGLIYPTFAVGGQYQVHIGGINKQDPYKLAHYHTGSTSWYFNSVKLLKEDWHNGRLIVCTGNQSAEAGYNKYVDLGMLQAIMVNYGTLSYSGSGHNAIREFYSTAGTQQGKDLMIIDEGHTTIDWYNNSFVAGTKGLSAYRRWCHMKRGELEPRHNLYAYTGHDRAAQWMLTQNAGGYMDKSIEGSAGVDKVTNLIDTSNLVTTSSWTALNGAAVTAVGHEVTVTNATTDGSAYTEFAAVSGNDYRVITRLVSATAATPLVDIRTGAGGTGGGVSSKQITVGEELHTIFTANASVMSTVLNTNTAVASENVVFGEVHIIPQDDDQVINGDFTAGTTGWAAGNGATLANDGSRLKITTSTTPSAYAKQDITTAIGATYKYGVDVLMGTASTVTCTVGSTDGGGELVSKTFTGDGTYYITFRATGTVSYVRMTVADLSVYATFDDVSVRKCQDIAVNGEFSEDADWTKGTGWTIASGVADCSGVQVGDTSLDQAVTATANAFYFVRFKVLNWVAGTVYPELGGAVTSGPGTAIGANGYYQQMIRCGTDGSPFIKFIGDVSFDGQIDDIHVYPAVLNVATGIWGYTSETSVNPRFDGSLTGWNVKNTVGTTGGQVSVEDGEFRIDIGAADDHPVVWQHVSVASLPGQGAVNGVGHKVTLDYTNSGGLEYCLGLDWGNDVSDLDADGPFGCLQTFPSPYTKSYEHTFFQEYLDGGGQTFCFGVNYDNVLAPTANTYYHVGNVVYTQGEHVSADSYFDGAFERGNSSWYLSPTLVQDMQTGTVTADGSQIGTIEMSQAPGDGIYGSYKIVVDMATHTAGTVWIDTGGDTTLNYYFDGAGVYEFFTGPMTYYWITIYMDLDFVGSFNSVEVIKFDVEDASMNRYDALMHGQITTTKPYPTTDLCMYSGFSDTNYIEIPENPTMDFSREYCFMWWMDTTNCENGDTIFSMVDSVRNDREFYAEMYVNGTTGKKSFDFWVIDPEGGWTSYGPTFDIPKDGLVLCAFGKTSDGNYVVYLNGSETYKEAYSGYMTRVAGPIKIGIDKNHTVGAGFKGSLAMFRHMRKLPTDSQMSHIYLTEKKLFAEGAKSTFTQVADDPYGEDQIFTMGEDPTTGKVVVGWDYAGIYVFDDLVITDKEFQALDDNGVPIVAAYSSNYISPAIHKETIVVGHDDAKYPTVSRPSFDLRSDLDNTTKALPLLSDQVPEYNVDRNGWLGYSNGTGKGIQIYDTKMDDDGGAWRKRAKFQSWTNKQDGYYKDRGMTSEFPEIAAFTYSASSLGGLWIWNLDGPVAEIWGLIPDNADSPILSYNVSHIYARNGIAWLGCEANAPRRLDFINDEILLISSTRTDKWSLGIGDIVIGGEWLLSTQYAYRQPSTSQYEINGWVSEDSPYDPRTGMRAPTIASGNSTNLTIHDGPAGLGTSVDITGVIFTSAVYNHDLKRLVGCDTVNDAFFTGPVPTADTTHAAWVENTIDDASIPRMLVTPGSCYPKGEGHILDHGGSNGFSFFKENPKSPTDSMLAYVGPDFVSGWYKGDPKFVGCTPGAIVSSIDDYLEGKGNFGDYLEWDAFNGWVVDADKATIDGTQTGTAYLGLIDSPNMGDHIKVDTTTGNPTAVIYEHTYLKVDFTITNWVAGTIVAGYGLDSDSSATGNGQHTLYCWPQGDNEEFFFEADVNFNGEISAATLTYGGERSQHKVGSTDILKVVGDIYYDNAVRADYQFNGTFPTPFNWDPAYMKMDYSADLDMGTDAFYLMGWLYNPTSTTTEVIVDRDSATPAQGFRLSSSTTGALTFRVDDGTTVRSAVGSEPTEEFNDWAMFIAQYEADGTVRLFVNGEEDHNATGAPLLTMSNASAILTIGVQADEVTSPLRWASRVALVRIGKGTYSGEEAAFIYKSERQAFFPPGGSQFSVSPYMGHYGQNATDGFYDRNTNQYYMTHTYSLGVWEGIGRTRSHFDDGGQIQDEWYAVNYCKGDGNAVLYENYSHDGSRYWIRPEEDVYGRNSDAASWYGNETLTTVFSAGATQTEVQLPESYYPVQVFDAGTLVDHTAVSDGERWFATFASSTGDIKVLCKRRNEKRYFG